jgi:stalled ribosome alternative rescue factor ArfA
LDGDGTLSKVTSKIQGKIPKPKIRNPMAVALALHFRNKQIKPLKGKGSYTRKEKHKK